MHGRRERRGSLYFLVLVSGVVLVGLVLGVTSLLMEFRHTSRVETQIKQAEAYAELGIRHGLYYTKNDPGWRGRLSNGQWMVDVSNGEGIYTLRGEDPVDGNLENYKSDPVVLTCTATVGRASRTLQVQAHNKPLELLRYALAGADDLTITNHVRITGDVTVNGDIDKSGADTWIWGDVECGGTITETKNISGTVTEGAEAKDFLDTVEILNFYKNRATLIPFRSVIENVVLSPSSNPFGETNEEGVYLVNCANREFEIKNCRILGTLILVNPGANSHIEKAIHWQSYRADYPALLVEGNIVIQTDADLDEADLKIDFSLPGEPGLGTKTDVLPNEIRGTIYVTGDLTMQKRTVVKGAVITEGGLVCREDTKVAADTSWATHPTVEFADDYLVAQKGSWMQITP